MGDVHGAVAVTGPATLTNGAEVLHYTEQHPGGNGFRRHGVALCQWRDEWITWVVYEAEPGRWHAESGAYFTNVVEAVEDYRLRGGR